MSILPLAALLTGTLLTLGIGVLLVVVLAIRKKRDPISRNSCDDKDKHLGNQNENSFKTFYTHKHIKPHHSIYSVFRYY